MFKERFLICLLSKCVRFYFCFLILLIRICKITYVFDIYCSSLKRNEMVLICCLGQYGRDWHYPNGCWLCGEWTGVVQKNSKCLYVSSLKYYYIIEYIYFCDADEKKKFIQPSVLQDSSKMILMLICCSVLLWLVLWMLKKRIIDTKVSLEYMIHFGLSLLFYLKFIYLFFLFI